MLTEHFVASIAAQTKPSTTVAKDAGIFFHEHQPLAAQRHVFKKSATPPNGLAVSSSHIFAAQADKAVVHVYSREKGNQEAVVPFPERIHSIALAATDTVLLLGTESGRVLAWEICSGRLVSTSTSHLQPVTSLAVDPTSNFFLSGSADSMIHVWALPSILSFLPDTSRSPMHTLSTHRGPIAAIVCGHSSTSANVAVSISEDKSAIVWDYYNGQMLRTYLLPELPKALALDPADRALYLAYGDGSLQTANFYDEVQKGTPIDALRDSSSSHRPLQLPVKTRFGADSQKLGAALSLSLSWDGTTLISGHASGKIATWDIAKRAFLSAVANLPGPVTNLQFLEPTGFPNAREPPFKVHTIVKPKQDTGLTEGNRLVPPSYSLTMQFTGYLPSPPISATESGTLKKSEFEEALSHPSFPQAMLDEGLAELATWNASSKNSAPAAADFVPLTGDGVASAQGVSEAQSAELAALQKQVASLQRIQKATFEQLAELREENDYFRNRARKRQKATPPLHTPMGAGPGADGDVEMSGGAGEADSESDHGDDDGGRGESDASSSE